MNSWSISPSELKTADCSVRYTLKYVLKLDRGEYESESTEFGDEVHLALEAWTTHGTPPNRETQAGKVALAMLPHAPQPGTGRAEGKFKFEINGINYGGKYDHSGLAGHLADRSDVPPGLPAITDYKTSTDPEQYGLWGKDAFLSDYAAVLYAAERLQRDPAPEILVRWLYAKLTKGKVKAPGQDDITIEMGAEMMTKFSLNKWRAKPSDAVLTYAEVERAYLDKVEPQARKVLRLRLVDTEEKALRLDRDLTLCTEYRGCPHQHRCARVLSQSQRIQAGFKADLIGDIDMALAPGLLSTLGGASKPTTAPAAPSLPAFKGFKGANPPEVQAIAESLPLGLGRVETAALAAVAAAAPTFTAAPELAPATPEAQAADKAELQLPAQTFPASAQLVSELSGATQTQEQVLNQNIADAGVASDARLGRAVREVMEAWAAARAGK